MTIYAVEQFGEVLSGKLAARRDFAKACDLLAGTKSGSVVTLNFAGVKYVSGSWINWMLVPLLNFAADDLNDYYLVLADFPQDSIDDLHLIADAEHTPFLVRMSDEPTILVGKLDPGQVETLEAVRRDGEVTGASLADAKVRATAWNNRLRDLNLKRLLRRRKSGREQVYSLLIPEVQIHG